ncbi:predicted protein [Nematostella vectensis]|uniref:Uncharacterized protein n=1 Tax=Nematostella vectensis TaxID=45351 RepID=A7RGT5_NEMVE|nr:predicted protein [Nematostella vectensis]|eukprot:XP_001641172.1 predicted protein [Nematostella vectensis]
MVNRKMFVFIVACLLVALLIIIQSDVVGKPGFMVSKMSRTPPKSPLYNVVLVIIYHYPYYETLPIIRSFYEKAFRKIIVCGAEANETLGIMGVAHENGYWGYECLGKAARDYPGYEGYLQIHDDILFQWWNVFSEDRTKIWLFGDHIEFNSGGVLGGEPPTDWPWWKKTNILERTGEVFRDLRNNTEQPWINESFRIFYANSGGNDTIPTSRGDIWYIPGRLAERLGYLSSLFFKHRVFLETAVPTMMSFLDYTRNVQNPGGLYLSTKYGYGDSRDSPSTFWSEYRKNLTFLHPFKLRRHDANLRILEELVMPFVNNFVYKKILYV